MCHACDTLRAPKHGGRLTRACVAQLAVVASTPVEAPLEALAFSPRDGSRVLARSQHAGSLLFASGKARLLERALSLPPQAAGADVTALAWHPLAGLYLATSAGSVVAYTDSGEAVGGAANAQAATERSDVAGSTHGSVAAREVLQLHDTNGEQRAIACLVSYSGGFAAALAGTSCVALCSHFSSTEPAQPQLRAICTIAQASTIAALVCADGGADGTRLAALSGDGLHMLFDAAAAAQQQKAALYDAQVLAEAPCGCITGAAATGRAGEVATVSTDGTLRIWDVAIGAAASKRTFSAPLSALAAAPAAGLLAVGAASGVVRIVASSAADLGVAAHTRVAAAPVQQLAACDVAAPPGGGCLLAALAGGTAYAMQVNAAGDIVSVAKLPLPAEAAPATCVAFAAGMLLHKPCVIVATAAAEAFCVPLPGARVSPRDLARGVATFRLPLPAAAVHMVCAPGAKDSTGTLFVACVDGRVRAFVLPGATDAWEAAGKGPAAVPVADLAVTGAAAGACLALLPGGSAAQRGEADMLHASASGTVTKLRLRGGALTADGESVQAGAAGACSGAPAVVAPSADGNVMLVAAAVPAAALCCRVATKKLASELPEVPQVSIDLDMDTVSDTNEPMFDAAARDNADDEALAALASTPRSTVPSTPPAAGRAAGAAAAHATYLQLRQRFASLLSRNATADDAAKLLRQDLAVDAALVAHMRGAAKQAAAAVRARVQRTDAARAVIAARVRAHCDDAAATHGAAVGGLQTRTVVHNFATVAADAEGAAELAQLGFLRGVEEVEIAARLPHGGTCAAAPLTIAVDATGAAVAGDEGDGTPRADAGDVAAPHSSLITPAESGVPLAHSDWALHTAGRRATNAALLSAAASAVRARFNAGTFAKVAAARTAAAERIAEGNARLAAIGAELAALGHAARPEDLQPFAVLPATPLQCSAPPRACPHGKLTAMVSVYRPQRRRR